MGALTEKDCITIREALELSVDRTFWSMYVYTEFPEYVIVQTPSVSIKELKELEEKGFRGTIFAVSDYVQLWISQSF